MKFFTFLLTFLSFIVMSGEIQLTVEEHSLLSNNSAVNAKYWLAVNNDKASSPAPLLIYLHGRGGVDNSLNKIKKQVNHIAKHTAKYSNSSFYFVAPQTSKTFSQGGGWVVPELNNLLSQLKKKYNIDSDRVYLIGNSMGGMGTWIWAAAEPDSFAAIAPISGGLENKMKQYIPNGVEIQKDLANMPVWAFAGGKDKVVPAYLSENLIKDIQREGNQNAHFKLYPQAKHNVRTEIFASKEIYDWLFGINHK